MDPNETLDRIRRLCDDLESCPGGFAKDDIVDELVSEF